MAEGSAVQAMRSGWGRALVAFVLVGVVALLPRVLDLGGFITHDEAEFWLDRSETFLEALQAGDYAATAISTHPGVTTMWLGSAGIVLRRALLAWGLVDAMPFPLLLALMRLPATLVHVVGVLAGYALLRRMLPAAVALLAALLWATDPFIIAYSRVLHTDALLATFLTLSLLAACIYWHHGRQGGMLLLSAVCGALAVLSKSPGLIVLPMVAVMALWGADMRRAPLAVLRPLLAWGAAFVVALVVVWPAVWANPARVYELLTIGVGVEASIPHMTGNFFLGQREEVPGPLYYPAAVLLRLTPWTLAGLLLLPWGWREARSLPATRRDLLVLVGFALLFVLAMSVFPKKFNRYLVPIFPALDVLAAVGLLWGGARLAQAWRAGAQARQRVTSAVVGGVALLGVANAAWWHPYSIAAFNQALGGARAGAFMFSVGWGEGFGQVADWLNQQPDITDVLTVSRMISSLNPYLREGAQAFFPSEGELRDNAGYLVVYISEVQGGPPLPPSDQFYGQVPPLHVVTIHGVDYAWIYQTPPPAAQPQPARFGEHIRLYGFAQEAVPPGERVPELTLFWQAQAPVATDYWLFARVLGPDGQTYAQLDLPYAMSTWEPGRYVPTHLPLTLPPDAPPGTYRVVVGLYDPASGERLPLEAASPADPAQSGPHALLLTRVQAE
jgi:4-amino-4-deoxy-L-arabinose transferase-like glycosyltransferase